MITRTSLWKRAAWHGFKHLFRRHPIATVSAAGAGLAYAGKEIAQESAEAIRETVAALGERPIEGPGGAAPASRLETPKDSARQKAPPRSHQQLSDADRRTFWESLSPAAQEALKDAEQEAGNRRR